MDLNKMPFLEKKNLIAKSSEGYVCILVIKKWSQILAQYEEGDSGVHYDSKNGLNVFTATRL